MSNYAVIKVLVKPNAIVVFPEQATDYWPADPVIFLIETFLNVSQTTVEPLFVAHRIACCVGRHDV